MSHAVLVVDDEQEILESIKRLLRRDGYEIHLADRPEIALEILAATDVAVVICDQRMPGMSGAQVLAEAARLRPDAYRITITGYADVKALQQSINDGQVNQFLCKPWDDEQLRKAVQHGAGTYQLVRDNRELEALTRQQKAELEELNRHLEQRVRDQTQELLSQNTSLRQLQGCLERSLRDTVRVLANTLEAHSPNLAIHSRRVANLARQIASRLGLEGQTLRDVEFAAHLHDIGKLSKLHGVESVESRPHGGHQKHAAVSHADCGYAILSQVGGFEDVTCAIRHQNERYDGQGGPEGLAKNDIPIAARIIAAANAYDKAVYPLAHPTSVFQDAGVQVLRKGRGTQFDPRIVDLLLELAQEQQIGVASDLEVELSAKQLHPGMVLARELRTSDGVCLLKKGTALTEQHIEHIRSLSAVDPALTSVLVQCAADKPGHAVLQAPPPEVPGQRSVVKETPPSARASAPSSGKKRALIVDDDALVCSALIRELRRADWEAVCVNDGRAAQNILEDQQFDILLVDVAMPVLSGDLLIAHVQLCFPEQKCIVLTGNAKREQIVRISAFPGVLKILAKPWDNQELIDLMNAAVAGQTKTLQGTHA